MCLNTCLMCQVMCTLQSVCCKTAEGLEAEGWKAEGLKAGEMKAGGQAAGLKAAGQKALQIFCCCAVLRLVLLQLLVGAVVMSSLVQHASQERP